MEAPDKIYISPNSFYATKVLTTKYNRDDIEYVRKDDFMKKACEYLMEYEFNDSWTMSDRRKRVERFKKYMEEKTK